MRLVLDEMWSAAIAEQLRSRGHDAIAAQEHDHRPRYGGITDELSSLALKRTSARS